MKKRNIGIGILIFALFTMLLAGCGGTPTAAAVGYLSMDVNPGIELSFDGEGKVLTVQAMNPQAEEAIGSIDYTGNDVEEVAEALIYRIAMNGHLTTEDAHILLSSDNSLLSKKVLDRVYKAITEQVALLNPNATLLNQVYEMDDDVREEAHAQGMTAGRYLYTRDILQANEQLTWEELETLRIAELARRARGYDDSLYDDNSPYDDDNSPYDDDNSPYDDGNSPYDDGNSPYDDGNSPYDDSNSPYDDSPYQAPPAPAPQPPADSPYDNSPYDDSGYDDDNSPYDD